MRVLVATTAGEGHFGPMVPFASALRAAGHDVIVAAPSSFASAVERAGFRHHPFADTDPEELQAVFGSLGELSNDEGNAVVVGEVFGRLDARAARPGLEAFVSEWRPDLCLRESWEFGSYLVAEAAGIPHVEVSVGLADFADSVLPVLEEPLTELGAEPGLANLRSAPRLTLVPESLDGGVTEDGRDIRRFREERSGADDAPLPDWWAGSSHPLLYVTFGSVAAGLGLFPRFYQEVIAALSELPIRVLLTTGGAGDPELLGAMPANVHVEKWWPQRAVMRIASAMVGHGGFGTTLIGLASGVPMVVVPLFADQPHNARRVEAAGAGIALAGGASALGALGAAVQRVLDQASYRTAASRIAEEIGGLPTTSDSVPYLEAQTP